jgi:hypothetical protein
VNASPDVLFVTLDSCRYDAFAAAAAPNLRAIGPLVRAYSPSHFTFGAHAAFFMGFTPGDPARREPYANSKFGKIFRMTSGGHRGVAAPWIELAADDTPEGRLRGQYADLARRAIARAGLTEAEARLDGATHRNSSGFWLPGESENNVRMFAEDALDAAATAVLLTLRAYQLENGALPGSLGDLVPRYLECVPADPQDGEPLRYSRERGVVYSVGDDSVDEGGAEEGGPRFPREPTFPIEF